MKLLAAVVGHPIRHSLSPRVFAFLAKRIGVRGELEYRALDIPGERLKDFLLGLKRAASSGEQWVGVNVTVPHKEATLKLLDEVSDEARAIGAVNVVKVENGHLIGFNTDVSGIADTFEAMACDVRGRAVLIVGAGGAARAAAYACARAGAARISIQNRDQSRAENLCRDFSARFTKTEFAVANSTPQPVGLVIQATPRGMGQSSSQSLNEDVEYFQSLLSAVPVPAKALDLIYRPERTAFIRAAERRGHQTWSGLTMFVGQALATWEIWHGPIGDKIGEKDQVRRELENYLRVQVLSADENPGEFQFRRSVFLSGFMGVGKSTVGRLLSRELNCPFFDTDAMIEQRTGESVARFFAEKGEAEFRRIEAEILQNLNLQRPSVVALGGGTLINPENENFVRSRGELVVLRASPTALMARLELEWARRPLLANMSSEDRTRHLTELLHAREAMYARADKQVPTDGLSPEKVVENILRILREG